MVDWPFRIIRIFIMFTMLILFPFCVCLLVIHSAHWFVFVDPVNRQQFLDPGESVLMISMVKKLQKLTSKKVQLILTNKPKLIYVDPSKLVVKGNIIWSDNSNDLSIQVSSPSHFKIVTVFPLLPFYPPGCITKSDIFKLLQSFTVNCVIVLSTDDNLKNMNVTLCSSKFYDTWCYDL